MSSGTVYDPQTWNRYSYAINNPLKWSDPDGLYIWKIFLAAIRQTKNSDAERMMTRTLLEMPTESLAEGMSLGMR